MHVTARKIPAAPSQVNAARGAPNWGLLCQFALLFALLAALYWPVLEKLVRQWADDPNYSHGFLVPLCSALLLWKIRASWAGITPKPSFAGLFLVIVAMALLVVGSLGAELFLSRASFCLSIGGLVVYFAGWRALRAVLAPWLLLFLMIPLPVIIFNEVAFPLQLLASRIACALLELLRIPVLREGNIIVLPSMSLDIVEACSGLRSLMSLVTIVIFYSLFFERRVWMRCLLVLLAIPVAVVANALRITVSALLTQFVSPQLAEGFFHAFSGVLLFLASLLALAVLHVIASRFAKRWMAT